MTSRTRLSAALLTLLSLAACDGVVEPGERAQEKVLFLRFTDPAKRSVIDTVEVYRVNADGTGLQNLTNYPAVYRNVSASPDGRKVAFESNRGGSLYRHVWVMNIEGTELRQLTTQPGYAPRWSPDGTRIAFEMVGSDDLLHVYVSNADGTNRTKVSGPAMQVGNTCGTSTTQSRIELVGWVGNGRVAFARYYCGFGYRNFLVNPDGSGFTQTDIRLWNAHFSPDGSQVVVSRYEGGSWKVVLMNADGTGARVLSTQGVQQGLPENNRFRGGYNAWSPDGKRILFFAETSPGSIANEPQSCSDGALPYVVNVDGSGVQPLMDSCAGGSFNGWSRSGEQVAFTMSPGSGSSDIYAVKADGTGAVNLTNSPSWEVDAEWLPRQ
jgi:Tol biopolymer transport system component